MYTLLPFEKKVPIVRQNKAQKISTIAGKLVIVIFPLMVAGLYQSGTKIWYQLPMFTMEVLAITLILSYLRFRSGRDWIYDGTPAGRSCIIRSLEMEKRNNKRGRDTKLT